MEIFWQIQGLYERYMEESAKVRSKAHLFDGFMGFGNDPRKHPCHETFFRHLGGLVQEFLYRQPDEETVFTVTKWILEAPVGHEDEDAYWHMYAAHGYCRDMIGLLSQEHSRQLKDWYSKEFPRKKRLPVHDQVLKLLTKQAK